VNTSSSSSPVLDASQRAWRYWFADGLTNLVVGVGILLMSYGMLYPPHWPPKPLAVAAWAAALLLYVVIMARHRTIVVWLKARTTYPRTGYVATPDDDPLCASRLVSVTLRENGVAPGEAARLAASRRRTVYVMLGLVVIASFGMILIQQRWIWTAAGVLVAIAMFIARHQYRVSWIVPVGFPLLGLYLTFYVTDRHIAPTYFLVGWGAIFVLDGAVTLIRFLLQNPVPRNLSGQTPSQKAPTA